MTTSSASPAIASPKCGRSSLLPEVAVPAMVVALDIVHRRVRVPQRHRLPVRGLDPVPGMALVFVTRIGQGSTTTFPAVWPVSTGHRLPRISQTEAFANVQADESILDHLGDLLQGLGGPLHAGPAQLLGRGRVGGGDHIHRVPGHRGGVPQRLTAHQVHDQVHALRGEPQASETGAMPEQPPSESARSR